MFLKDMVFMDYIVYKIIIFKGITGSLVASGLEMSVTFFSYGLFNRLQGVKSDNVTMKSIIISSIFTSFSVAMVLTPTELLKCRMQVLYNNNIDATIK